LFTSGGQRAFVPLHVSGGSQPPTEARQTVPAVTKSSAGQSFPCPSQLSATSHGPAEGRQAAVLLASGGQAGLLPVQLSARSQTPANGRHSVPAGPKASGGPASPTPSHPPATSHAPPHRRQPRPL